MTDELTFYSTPGPMTDLTRCAPALFDELPDDPRGLMSVVRGVVTSAEKVAVPEGRGHEAAIRPAADIVARIAEIDPSPLVRAREPLNRFIGNCRTYATLSCALMRRAGIPVRVRAGFAGYFRPDAWVDHWIIEYWDDRWVRVDPELDDEWLAQKFPGATSERVATDRYLTGTESWIACRSGELDAGRFNMGGINWGIGEIRGSVAYDFAAINQDEMLPWDAWCRMEDAYKSITGDDYDAHLDVVSAIVVRGDFVAIRDAYVGDELLRVPASLSAV